MAGQKLTRKEQQYVEWLRETLIPDLKDSGSDATAEDFETLIRIIERLTEVK